jgi:CO dehydrogenase/acetyl-CoA synthase beta subunit
MFQKYLTEIRSFLNQKSRQGELTRLRTKGRIDWPESRTGDIVVGNDIAVELGAPDQPSVSFLIWTDSKNIRDGQLSLVGPDLLACHGKSLPFGKILIIGAEGFNEENSYHRYREVELLRYEIKLKGYMMRAASQYQREWCRISREAIKNNFSFTILGNALLEKVKKKDYVNGAEVIFITSCAEDVKKIKEISRKVVHIIEAMNKMINEMALDCEACEYQEVCSEVDALRKLHKKLKNQNQMRHDG